MGIIKEELKFKIKNGLFVWVPVARGMRVSSQGTLVFPKTGTKLV